MPTDRFPGVYVGELAARPRIERVAAGVAAFIGVAPQGPVNTPTVVSGWPEFAATFGTPAESSYLAAAVRGYFDNGGRRCCLIRVSGAGPADLLGSPENGSGLYGLDSVENVDTVCAPDLMAADGERDADLGAISAVQRAMVDVCESRRDCMAILDPPPHLSSSEALGWLDGVDYHSAFAALYFPWVEVVDSTSGSHRFVPPSGHVAGVWARAEAEHGVHRAPANEPVHGAVGLQWVVTRAEQEVLGPSGINTIRNLAGQGIRLWGARTLSRNPEWRYLSVRRLLNELEKSISMGTRFAAFEPPTPALWSTLRGLISDFLTSEWRRGALVGRRPEEAFFVRCDESTNPPSVVDAGRVVCLIGVAPAKPAEFTVFTLTQHAAGPRVVTN